MALYHRNEWHYITGICNLTLLNDTGKVFMTPTIYNGQKGIRAAFVNWRTTKNDVEIATKLMTEIINELK